MIFTKRADYGLRTALELAAHYNHGPLSATQIAGESGLPEPFVKKLLQQLADTGIAQSIRGRHGGYLLTRAPGDCSVRQVLSAFEELAPVSCLQHADVHGRAHPPSQETPSEAPCALEIVEHDCPTRAAWELVDREMQEALDSLTLAELLEEMRTRGLPLKASRYG